MIILSLPPQTRQNGYVLLTTLVLMTMLTVLALNEVSMNSSQTRIAANASDSEISFEKTEGAVNEAVNNLFKSAYNPDSFLNNVNGLYTFDPTTAPKWKSVNWSSGDVINSFQGNTSAQSNFIIEQLPSVVAPGQNMKTPTRVYRITAHALQANGNSTVLLQTNLQIQ